MAEWLLRGCGHAELNIGQAVDEGIIANETLGYFIARTYLFLVQAGIDHNRLRFRQHLQHEMAHYACDCWDAEVETSYGWIECVGLADRSAFDLDAHTKAAGVDLNYFLKYDKPIEMDVVKVLHTTRLTIMASNFCFCGGCVGVSSKVESAFLVVPRKVGDKIHALTFAAASN